MDDHDHDHGPRPAATSRSGQAAGDGTTDRPAEPGTGEIEFYWRPGCPFSWMLRLQLQDAGLPLKEVNIWDDPDAATRVRRVTGGDETVPTVIVGREAMVNPTAGQVLSAVRTYLPEYTPPPDPDPVPDQTGHSNETGPPAAGRGAISVLATLALAGAWVLLAGRHPTTTYHLAPGLVAAAAPFSLRMGRNLPLPRPMAASAVAVGLVVAVGTAATLARSGNLAGPTVTGGNGALTESLIAALLGALLGLWLTRRASTSARRADGAR